MRLLLKALRMPFLALLIIAVGLAVAILAWVARNEKKPCPTN